ncbi:hypothetical protein [Anabaena sp. 4-3]|uniref:hypothetical protein n=1 Tax=Anabaena sp. 4-3 TaxID=1811979 RepID=UPI0012E74221|nr:hypothetical protein [Anabaena sp. 4-3]
MNIEQLQWVKNIKAFYPKEGGKWAYQFQKGEKFALHWRNKDGKDQKNANNLAAGDMIILRQLGKVTHIVQVLDNELNDEDMKSENEFNIYRNVQVIWITDNWDNSPSVGRFFEAKSLPQGGKAYQIKRLEAFKKRWGETGLPEFQKFIQKELNINENSSI